ncbi:hypothetical protein MHB43_17755 [Paenibacillus sp. FSL H8-0317]|uniref:hypothetical protein n=1 Tax=Paenibacillus sp. FSL H8-0317 TaxID=2921385 RepID=UPI0032458675
MGTSFGRAEAEANGKFHPEDSVSEAQCSYSSCCGSTYKIDSHMILLYDWGMENAEI